MVRYPAPPCVRVPHRYRKPLNATLSGLTIGSLTLTPAFDPEVTSYTATTSNATNTVNATPADGGATVTIALNGDIMLGSTATWDDGENVLEISVMNGGAFEMYTVAVTKE